MPFRMPSELLAQNLQHTTEHWEKRRADAAHHPSGKVPLAWTVAISREAGSRGSSIARRVGELLGWHVYDRELLQKIADEKGLRVRLLEHVDEKHTSWLESSLEGLQTGPHVSEVAFASYLAETLYALAALGECVIVGRGSAFILPPHSTLRVRLTGLEKDRVAYIARHFALPEKEAADWVRQTDHDRAWFVREYFHKDPNELTQYDLVVNTSRFSNEAAAQVIAQAARQMVG